MAGPGKSRDAVRGLNLETARRSLQLPTRTTVNRQHYQHVLVSSESSIYPKAVTHRDRMLPGLQSGAGNHPTRSSSVSVPCDHGGVSGSHEGGHSYNDAGGPREPAPLIHSQLTDAHKDAQPHYLKQQWQKNSAEWNSWQSKHSMFNISSGHAQQQQQQQQQHRDLDGEHHTQEPQPQQRAPQHAHRQLMPPPPEPPVQAPPLAETEQVRSHDDIAQPGPAGDRLGTNGGAERRRSGASPVSGASPELHTAGDRIQRYLAPSGNGHKWMGRGAGVLPRRANSTERPEGHETRGPCERRLSLPVLMAGEGWRQTSTGVPICVIAKKASGKERSSTTSKASGASSPVSAASGGSSPDCLVPARSEGNLPPRPQRLGGGATDTGSRTGSVAKAKKTLAEGDKDMDKDKDSAVKSAAAAAAAVAEAGRGEVRVDTSMAHSVFYLPCLKRVAQKLQFLELTSSRAKDPSVDVYWHDILRFPVTRFHIARLGEGQRMNRFLSMQSMARKNVLAKRIARLEALFPDDYNYVPKTWRFPWDVPAFKKVLDLPFHLTLVLIVLQCQSPHCASGLVPCAMPAHPEIVNQLWAQSPDRLRIIRMNANQCTCEGRPQVQRKDRSACLLHPQT